MKNKNVLIGILIGLVVILVAYLLYNTNKSVNTIENNNKKESCLVITSPVPNQTVSFPLDITGYIDIRGARNDTCGGWGAFEGTAGSVLIKDASGNIKSSSVSLYTIGDYSVDNDKWSIKATIENLTGVPYTKEVSLYFSSEIGEPSRVVNSIVSPLILSDYSNVDSYTSLNDKFIESGVDNNGRHIGYIKNISSVGNNYSLEIDYIQWIGCNDSDCPNGFKIVNGNSLIRTFPVLGGITATVLTQPIGGLYDSGGQQISLNSLQTLLQPNTFWTDSIPFWITLKDGKVSEITEQYVP